MTASVRRQKGGPEPAQPPSKSAYVLIRADVLDECCLTDDADVLYNKFNVYSSPPNNIPYHTHSDYNCVVATTDHWRVSRCAERRHVVCQSLTGIMTTCLHQFFVQFCTSAGMCCYQSSLFVRWLVILSFVISRKLQVRFSRNWAQMFSICANIIINI